MKTCAVIYNPNSGHTLNRRNIPKYKALIEKLGYDVTFIPTKYKGHAREIVSHIGYVDLVMSMGGDGTFNEVVYGNLTRRQKLLVTNIPVGTTNDVGTMWGYSKSIEKNIEMCLKGVVKEMDMCLINGRPFVYVAGVGKYMGISYDTPRDLKKKYGRFAYFIWAVKDYFKKTKVYDVDFTINGEKHHGEYSVIIVSNSNRIAGVSNFYKDVKLDDDRFEIVMCKYRKRIEIIKGLAEMAIKGADRVKDPNIEHYRTDNLKIKLNNHSRNPWCVDGEKLEIRSSKYEIKNYNGFKVLLPNVNIDKLFINKENH